MSYVLCLLVQLNILKYAASFETLFKTYARYLIPNSREQKNDPLYEEQS